MLILAGVSLNAIIGDNGIITNAQNANILQSCAVLSEYLNELYVEEYDSTHIEDTANKTNLDRFIRNHTDLFFFNNSDDYVLVDYTDNEGNTSYYKLRLIRKNNLIDDVKSQLNGGDANGDSLEAYLNLQDVFGVTQDLKVFYCSDGLATCMGADFSNSSQLNGSIIVYEADSGVSKALSETLGLTENNSVSLAEARATRTMTISDSSGLTNLSFLYDLPNVTSLTFQNYSGSLEGLEYAKKITYIYFDNTDNKNDIDFSGIEHATSLIELYFYNPTNEKVEALCNKMHGSDYLSLETLGFYGWDSLSTVSSIIEYSDRRTSSNGGVSNLTTLESLDYLSELTKQEVKVLYVNNNRLSSLKGIENFISLESLYLNNNYIVDTIKTLEGETTETIYGISSYINNMSKLTTFFFSYSGCSVDDFENITNSSIRNIAFCGVRDVRSFDSLLHMSNLNNVQGRGISSAILSEDAAVLLSKAQNVYLDNKYMTVISLKNIKAEVVLGTDATNASLKMLENNETVTKLSIVNNTNITDDKLQEILPTLNKLTMLVADSSNLASFDFVSEGSKLEDISVMNCGISDLSNLADCSNLKSLRINTSGLDLRPYSTIISNMCAKNQAQTFYLGDYVVKFGGIIAPASILNTLNGTSATDINTNLTNFGIYCSDYSQKTDVIDLSFTGLINLRHIWVNGTIKIPSTCVYFLCGEIAGANVDMSNLESGERVYVTGMSVNNNLNFTGFKSVTIYLSGYLNAIGDSTLTLNLGTNSNDRYTNSHGLTSPKNTYDFSNIATKAPNITDFLMIGAKGIANFEVIKTLSLTNFYAQYSSISSIGSIADSNMAKSLITLTVKNGALANIAGIKDFEVIRTIDFSNNDLENLVPYTDSDGKSKNMDICEYLVTFCPTLKSIKLSGNAKITDFSALTNAGFSESKTTPGLFTRN